MNKQLQHIATALLLLVLIGAGKAWGQTTLYTCASNGDWSNAAIWFTDATCTTPHGSIPGDNPVVIKNGANIISNIALSPLKQVTIESGATLAVTGNFNPSEAPLVSGTLTVSGSITISGGSAKTIIATGGTITVTGAVSFPVEMTIDGSLNVGTTFTGKRINTGSSSSIVVGGNYTVDAPSTFNGYARIGGSYSGTEITSGATSTVVILGNVTTNGTVNIAGDLLVTGNYTMNGGTMTVANGGAIAVGGDFTKAAHNVVIQSGGYGVVYGDYNSTGGNTTITAPGEFVTLGSLTGSPVCSTCTDRSIDSDDPIWTYSEGYRQLYWVPFDADNGATNNWTRYSPTVVSGGLLTANNTSTTVLWETGEIFTGCYSNLDIVAKINGTAPTLARTQLQYSTYSPSTGWSAFEDGILAPGTDPTIRSNQGLLIASRIKLRLVLLDYIDSELSFDYISISGTKTYGEELPTPTLASGYNKTAVCAGEIATYRLQNTYDIYSWSIVGNGTPLSATNTDEFQVQWNVIDATTKLRVEVRNLCGQIKTAEWTITNSGDPLTVSLIEKVDLTCFTTNSGRIKVQAFCGSGNYQYDWSDLLGAQRYNAEITGLAAGFYTVTVSDLTNTGTPAVVQTYEITSLGEIKIKMTDASVTKSCDFTIGCNGEAEFEVEGGDGRYTFSLTGGPSSFVPKQLVRFDYTSPYYTQTGYQLKVNVTKAEYPEMLNDFSDVRFFADPLLETPIPFWMDPSASSFQNGVKATFYVKTDLVEDVTKSIYMTYGDPAVPGGSSITDVMDQGQMFVRYYNDAFWGSMIGTCADANNQLTYNLTYPPATNINFSSCSTGKTTADVISVIWSGWYTIPTQDLKNSTVKYIKIDVSNANAGTVIFKVNGSSLAIADLKNNVWQYDIGSYPGKTVYLEIQYSKPINQSFKVDVAFAQNMGNGINTGNDRPLYPNQAYSRKVLSPEPIVKAVKSAKYTGLCESTDPNFYVFRVTDGTGCFKEYQFEIFSDTDNPTWKYLPPDVNILKLNAESVTQTIYYESFKNIVGTSGNGNWAAYRAAAPTTPNWTDFEDIYSDIRFKGNSDAWIQKQFPTLGFSNIRIELTAYQSLDLSDVNGWNADDYLQVQWSEDAGTTWNAGNIVVTDYEIWRGGTTPDPENYYVPGDGNSGGATFLSAVLTNSTSTPLAANRANENANFMVRIRFKSNNADEKYSLQTMRIIGDNLFSVNPDDIGEGIARTNEPDTDVTFRDYTSGTCNDGYLIRRQWMAVDPCGNPATHNQFINIAGQEIEFETPDPNATLDFTDIRSFCRNQIEFTVPAVTSPCATYTLHYTFNDGATYSSAITEAPGTKTTITFPVGVTETAITTMHWYAIDEAGFPVKSPYSYVVRIGTKISIPAGNWSYNPSNEICEGDNVTVIVTPIGGSGTYNSYSFESTVPAIVSGPSPEDPLGSWSTNGFKTGDYVIVDVTDSDNCTQENITSPSSFTVHEGITTNPIQPAP